MVPHEIYVAHGSFLCAILKSNIDLVSHKIYENSHHCICFKNFIEL